MIDCGITLAAQAETRAAIEVQATQWPIVTALVYAQHGHELMR